MTLTWMWSALVAGYQRQPPIELAMLAGALAFLVAIVTLLWYLGDPDLQVDDTPLVDEARREAALTPIMPRPFSQRAAKGHVVGFTRDARVVSLADRKDRAS